MRSRSSLAAVALFLAGCPDETLGRVFPDVAVDPTTLDFGVGTVGADNPGTLTVLNRGAAPLDIAGYRVEPAGGPFRVASGPDVLAPSGSEPAALVFTPVRAHEESRAELVLSSNDPDTPELRVPLIGVGGVREIEVTPPAIDFGVVDEGTSPPATRSIEIANIGGDPLAIAAVTWTSTSVDLGLEPGGFTGGVLAPGTSTVVRVVYAPTDLGGDRGVVTIRSDDEDEPMVEVPVRGMGNLAPRAIVWGCEPHVGQIGCDGAVRKREWSLGLRQRIGLDGRESADPEGSSIRFQEWRVVRPASSGASVFMSTDDRRLRNSLTGDIEVDQVGQYVVRLIVTDDRGIASLDRPESRVTIRPKDLELLLRWDVGTDVDVHVVRPGGTVGDYGTGAVGTSTGSDVTSFNRAPNWGDLASSDDDPRLDIDDVSGRGPEIVSLDGPLDGGGYALYAHYCDSRNVGVPVAVFAEVYVRGVLVARVPDGDVGFPLVPGELWRAADVVWRAGSLGADVTAGTMNRPERRPELCRR